MYDKFIYRMKTFDRHESKYISPINNQPYKEASFVCNIHKFIVKIHFHTLIIRKVNTHNLDMTSIVIFKRQDLH